MRWGAALRGEEGGELQVPVCPAGREKEEVNIEFLRCSRALGESCVSASHL